MAQHTRSDQALAIQALLIRVRLFHSLMEDYPRDQLIITPSIPLMEVASRSLAHLFLPQVQEEIIPFRFKPPGTIHWVSNIISGRKIKMETKLQSLRQRTFHNLLRLLMFLHYPRAQVKRVMESSPFLFSL